MQNNRFSEKAYYVQKVHTGRGLEHNHKERQDWKFCYNWSEIWKWTNLHAHLILVFKKKHQTSEKQHSGLIREEANIQTDTFQLNISFIAEGGIRCVKALKGAVLIFSIGVKKTFTKEQVFILGFEV